MHVYIYVLYVYDMYRKKFLIFPATGITICCQILHTESDWCLISPYRMTPESTMH